MGDFPVAVGAHHTTVGVDDGVHQIGAGFEDLVATVSTKFQNGAASCQDLGPIEKTPDEKVAVLFHSGVKGLEVAQKIVAVSKFAEV